MITITEEAQKKIELELSKDSAVEALRIQVIPGGCKGFEYSYSFISSADIKSSKDLKYQAGKAVVIISKVSDQLLDSATLNYIDRELGYSHFEVINNKADAKCSCGASFSIKL